VDEGLVRAGARGEGEAGAGGEAELGGVLPDDLHDPDLQGGGGPAGLLEPEDAGADCSWMTWSRSSPAMRSWSSAWASRAWSARAPASSMAMAAWPAKEAAMSRSGSVNPGRAASRPSVSAPRTRSPAASGTAISGPIKYDQTGVEPARRFQFRTEPGAPTGAVAANLAELEAELSGCGEGVLRHHCPGHDFSRWVADVFHDGSLAADLAAAEAAITPRSLGAVVAQVRLTLIAALQDRHPR